MRVAILRAALGFVVLAGCADDPWPRPPSVDVTQFTSEFDAWRTYRQSRLIAPGPGPVTWIGLWPLHDGDLTMGSDTSLDVVLPVIQSPKLAGTLHRKGAEVSFEPAQGALVMLADSTRVTTLIPVITDRNPKPTTLALGTLRLRVHGEPGTDRLWVRGWDEKHPDRETFRLPDSYPPDTAWRVAARFEKYAEPREYRVDDIAEGKQAYRSTGDLVFRIGKHEHRLAAFAETTDTAFFVMLWDSTARSTTYQAGRYMRVPFPDTTGWTVLDFNRAYSPPCVFTPYSTCAFAPPGNRLAVSILAGEKRVK